MRRGASASSVIAGGRPGARGGAAGARAARWLALTAALLLAAAPSARAQPAPSAPGADLAFGLELEVIGVGPQVRTVAERTPEDYRRVLEPVVRALGGDPAEIVVHEFSKPSAQGRRLLAGEWTDPQGRTWRVVPEWVAGGGRQQVDFELVTPKLSDPAELERVVSALAASGVVREGLQSSTHIHVDGRGLIGPDGDATALINLINLHERLEPTLRRLLQPARGAGIYNPKDPATGAEGAWVNRYNRPLYLDHPDLLAELAALPEGERTRARIEALFAERSAREAAAHGLEGLGTKGWKYRSLNLANLLDINPELPASKGSVEFRMNDLDLGDPATHRLQVELYRALVARARALAAEGVVVEAPPARTLAPGEDPAVRFTSADPLEAAEQVRAMLRELDLDPARYEGLIERNVRAPPTTERELRERLAAAQPGPEVRFRAGAAEGALAEALDGLRTAGGPRPPLELRIPLGSEAPDAALARAQGLAARADAALHLERVAHAGARAGLAPRTRVAARAEPGALVLTIDAGELPIERVERIARLLAVAVEGGAAVGGGLPAERGLLDEARRYLAEVEGRPLGEAAARALEALAARGGAQLRLPLLAWGAVDYLPAAIRRDLRFRAEAYLAEAVRAAEALGEQPAEAELERVAGELRGRVRTWARQTALGEQLLRSLLPPEAPRPAEETRPAEERDALARYRRPDGTLRWREVVRERALQEAGGLAHFGLALFLKEVAVVAATGDRARIEEFFDGLMTTDFYKHYGLFVAGARVGEVAYTRYLQRYVRPQFVNGMLKTNLVLAAGIALPLIVEGQFEGKAFAISLGSLGLSSAAVKAGVEGIRWVSGLKEAQQAGRLARFGLAGRRLMRFGGWFYTAAELAVVLFVAEKLEDEVNEYLDLRAARADLAAAGEAFLRAAADPAATPEALAAAADAHHEAWIEYRNFLYGPLYADEAVLAGRLEGLARTAKIKEDERAAAIARLERYPALRASIERRYGSVEAYADALVREDEGEIEREVNGYVDSYNLTRARHLEEVYRGNRREGPLLTDVDHLDWLLAGGRAGAPADPFDGRTDVFADWGRERARAALASAWGDASRNRLQAYDDEAEVVGAVAASLRRRGRADLAAVLEERREGVLLLRAADQALIEGDGLIDTRDRQGLIERVRALGD